ncbi:MAG TPA: hypothetical protein PLS16_04880 [Chitinophagales bacterium]|nr:hypothetical protein [Chitinophagales bacterium]
MKKTLLYSLIIFAFTLSFAQQQNLPLNFEWNNRLQRFINEDNRIHTAIKPYLQSEVNKSLVDSLNELGLPDTTQAGFKFGITSGDLISFRGKKKRNVYIAINPIVDFEVGYNTAKKSLQHSIGYGAQANFDLGKKLSLSFTYQGVTENYLNQISDYAKEYGVLTGYRSAKFNGNSISSQMFSGYLSFSPNKYVNLQIGNDKNFWGDGYRTFLLGDNSSNYPYIKFSTNFWRIKYVYLLNVMRYGQTSGLNVDNNTSNFKTKYGSFHYLSVDVAKWFEFGFFEGVTWYHEDSSKVRGIEFSYLIPTLFIRPIEFALGSPDNVILGLNFKFKPSNRQDIYLQLALDDMDVAAARRGRGFYRTKVAAQLGIKARDIFKVKHLDILSELNVVRPYVFAHKVPAQNYTNYNQSLVHPLGANFWENVTMISYWKRHWQASAKFQFARKGIDLSPSEHYGSNIFVSDYLISSDLGKAYNNKFLQGVKTNLINLEVRGGYLLNPKLNLALELVYNFRNMKNDYIKQNYHYFGLGIRTNLFNRYSDF